MTLREYVCNIFKRLNIEEEPGRKEKENGERDTRNAGNEGKKGNGLAAATLQTYLKINILSARAF